MKWFKFYQHAWDDGTRGLDLELRGAYFEIINLIMINDGPLPADYRWLHHKMHVSERKAKAVVTQLVALGKLVIDDRGISNARAEREIAERQAYRNANADAGRARVKSQAEAINHEASKICEQKQQKNASARSAAAQPLKTQDSEQGFPPTPRKRGAVGAGKVSAEQMAANAQATKDLLGVVATEVVGKRGQLRAAKQALLEDLQGIYNRAAKHYGLEPCATWTTKRNEDLLRRVAEIGGRDRFYAALVALKQKPIFIGLVPGKDGRDPFKVNIDSLLKPHRAFGDILAQLNDLAQAPKTATMPARNGKPWGWWREPGVDTNYSIDSWRRAVKDTKFQASPDWPWDSAGPPPGHDECFVPPEIIEEFNLIAKFGKANHA